MNDHGKTGGHPLLQLKHHVGHRAPARAARRKDQITDSGAVLSLVAVKEQAPLGGGCNGDPMRWKRLTRFDGPGGGVRRQRSLHTPVPEAVALGNQILTLEGRVA